MEIKNSIGPNIDPCGTPAFSEANFEIPSFTFYYLLTAAEIRSEKFSADILNLHSESFLMNNESSTKSKALLKSRNNVPIMSPVSMQGIRRSMSLTRV